MTILDIAKAVSPEAKHRIIGIRPGEKIHEQMIGLEDAINTFEYQDYYKILPVIYDWARDKERIKDGRPVADNFIYSSDLNNEWLSVEMLRDWLKNKYV